MGRRGRLMLAAFFQGPLVRIIPVGVVLIALQRTIFVELQVNGVILQITVAFAAAAGVAGGSERGAVTGFVVGVMYDLAEGTPLGSSAVALTVAGAVAGLLALVAADPQWWLAMIFVAFGAAAGEAMVPVVRLFIGETDPFDPRLRVVVPIVAAGSAVMSPVLVPLGRWCLRMKKSEWKVPPAGDGATA